MTRIPDAPPAQNTPRSTEDAPVPGRRSRAVAWLLRAVWVRSRFFIALIAAFLVVGRWDVLRTHWDRWTGPAASDPAMGAISADTEYFCPMEPGVVSDWPAKCPICHMALVRRKRGDMGPLPNGVIARVQLSPERVQLAGVQTSAVRYQPLARKIRIVGPAAKVEGGGGRLEAKVNPEDASWLSAGQEAEIRPDPADGAPAVKGKVRSVDHGETVTVEFPLDGEWPSRFASAVISTPVADREPFRSMPRGEPELRPGEPRTVYLCPNHPAEPQLQTGRCPKDENTLNRSSLARNERVGWWCPMHPEVTAEISGRKCEECGGMELLPRIITYCPQGQVLTVPESAVIDTGARRIVYVESMPGTFDGVEVRLGPRSGTFFPVVSGLVEGQKVAEAGAFLVDAETRLNPSLAAAYFGAARNDTKGGTMAGAVVAPQEAAQAEPLDFEGLSPGDRALAVTQEVCPVTDKKLGSMGPPVRLDVKGRAVFLCCAGCEGAVKKKPDQYLAKLRPPRTPAHHP